MVYSGAGGDFSPSDGDTVRYLDISGSIILNPVTKNYELWRDYVNNYFGRDLSSIGMWDMMVFLNGENPLGGEDKRRILRRRYYTFEHPEISEPPGGLLAAGSDAGGGQYASGMDMYAEDESQKFWKLDSSNMGDGRYKQDSIGYLPILRCMLVIGDKCLREMSGGTGDPSMYSWIQYKEREECGNDDEWFSQSFSIAIDPKLDDFIIGQEHKIRKNAHYSLMLDADGMVIPIRKSDNLHGAIRFMILGPENYRWDNQPMGFRPLWCSDSMITEAGESIMKYVSSIWIKDFEIKVISDEGGNDVLNENDILYVSETARGFVNSKGEDTFRICSSLTSQERSELGIKDERRAGFVRQASTGEGLMNVYDLHTGEQAKAEQLYVDWYYREQSQPRVELDQGIQDPGGDLMGNTWIHPALPDKRFYATRFSQDLQAGSAVLRLREYGID